jgi:hypothetical protein
MTRREWQVVKCTGNPRVSEVRPQPLPAAPANRTYGYGFWRVWVAGLTGFEGLETRKGQWQGSGPSSVCMPQRLQLQHPLCMQTAEVPPCVVDCATSAIHVVVRRRRRHRRHREGLCRCGVASEAPLPVCVVSGRDTKRSPLLVTLRASRAVPSAPLKRQCIR